MTRVLLGSEQAEELALRVGGTTLRVERVQPQSELKAVLGTQSVYEVTIQSTSPLSQAEHWRTLKALLYDYLLLVWLKGGLVRVLFWSGDALAHEVDRRQIDSREALASALSSPLRCALLTLVGRPFLPRSDWSSLQRVDLKEVSLDHELLRQFPLEACRRLRALPLSVIGGTVVVAMANASAPVIAEFENLSGYRVETVEANEADILEALESHLLFQRRN